MYAKGPVTITFSGSEFDAREITQFSRFKVENGRVIYNIAYDLRTKAQNNRQIMMDINHADQTKILDKPGLYLVMLTHPFLMEDVHTYIYIPDGSEDISYNPLTPETATATSAKVTVDSEEFNCNGYSINGDSYFKIRDVAFMLKGTAKHFDLANGISANRDLMTIKTADYNSAYTAVGGELSTVTSGTQPANPTRQTYAINGSELKPSAYDIDGGSYVKLKDLAEIVDFGLTDGGSTISINTSTGYSNIQMPSPITVGSTTRLAGNNRYQTAVAISKSGWSHSANVIIADGDNFPDALVGSSFAYLKDAPILITPPNVLDGDARTEIERLGAKTVYILGNTTSISSAIENDLKQKYNVIRIGGTEVLDTAVKVGEEVQKIKQFDTVALCTQNNFPDALAIAPFSARDTMPILYSQKDKLRDDTKKALQDWGIKYVVIAGGTGVISDYVKYELFAMGIGVYREAGFDRYDTALEIIKHFEPKAGYTNVSIATGENYPDALTGAVLAAKNNTPLVLVQKESVNNDIANYLSKYTLSKAYIFGGTAVVSTKLTGN